MRRLILGTAGHIDHGKTALVRALTGVDTDRLPEEKRRGITIDLGFAELQLDPDCALSVVDVPGHESFIRNMVAGASGIDMVLLVVAADEGVMPQTREHLAIIELLGIRRGVIALTKRDLVDDDWLELVREDARALLEPTALRAAEIVAVSARSGDGLGELRVALQRCAAGIEEARVDDLFRMPIDRVFTVRGTGTVVTGTVWSGSIRRDAQVRLLPSGIITRVRALQQHSHDCDEAVAGTRAAIALTGVERRALTRGDTVVAGPVWSAGSILTVDLDVIPDAAAPVTPRQRVRVHIGTAEVLGRVGMIARAIEPGARAIVQLRLEEPVVARAGDRIVVRSYSPVRTIAGGVVLEPHAAKRRRPAPGIAAALASLRASLDASRDAGRAPAAITRHASPDAPRDVRQPAVAAKPPAPAGASDDVGHAAVLATVELAGSDGAERRLLPLLTGLPPATVDRAVEQLRTNGAAALIGDRVIIGARLSAARDELTNAVREFHEQNPSADGIARDVARRRLPPSDAWLFDAALDGLIMSDALVPVGHALAAAGFRLRLSAEAAAALTALADVYRTAGLEPPELSELPHPLCARPDLPTLLRMLEREGTLLRLSAERWISAAAVLESARELKTQFQAGQAVGMQELKDILKLTRKHLIPLLEHFDRSGVTRREGDQRVIL